MDTFVHTSKLSYTPANLHVTAYETVFGLRVQHSPSNREKSKCVSKVLGLDAWERLCEKVGSHVLGRTVDKLNRAIFDRVADEMPLYVNMFCSGMELPLRMGERDDTHPIPLCMQTRLISHFTNSSNISTYQIPYRRQIRTCPNDPIVFPSQLCTGERIADSAQLRFHSLSPSI